FRTVVFARMIQTAGMAFLFVPINTAAYAFLPREKNNAASGLMNLARNIGGSVGISIVTTMLDRRQQFHLSRMSSHMTAAKSTFRKALETAAIAAARRPPSPDAIHKAYGMLQATFSRQASMLAYIDNFWLLG